MTVIIAISGHAGSGKDTFGQMVARHASKYKLDAYLYAFANHLKDQAKMLGWNGEKDEAGRSLLQHLGDVMREYHGDNYYAKYLCDKIRKESPDIAIVTDVRYRKELIALKMLANENGWGIITIRMIRENESLSSSQKVHSSEKDLDNYEGWTFSIKNNSTLRSLETYADCLVDTVRKIT